MSGRSSVDFVDGDRVPAADRGFAYGDGLFETLRVVDARAPLWPRHAARLEQGCARLRMPAPDLDAIHAEVLRLAGGMADAVVRVTVTRGDGPRGYAPPPSPRPRVVVHAAPLRLDGDAYAAGLALRLCETRLGDQPALAGMKHLNRLEQVLARAEWSDAAYGEGLMLDVRGDVACATAANVFAVFAGHLVTPAVDRCGVAGVARAEVLALRPAGITRMTPARLAEADEVFLTSAVRGILPIRVFSTRSWQPGPVTRALQAHWGDIGLPLPVGCKDPDR
ncbi:MAG: aminodeoxychorismate lyase [Luteibacter sp.]